MNRFVILMWLCVCATTGCAVNPVTGKSELSLISEADEIQMGAQQYLPSQQSQGGEFTTDPELSAYVNEVGQRVVRVSDRDLPYEFVVLNNSVPNAWALPGGKIAVNRGLLLELENEAELAAVLGHEAVHAAAKHGANAMQRGMMLQGLLMATAIGVADSDYANYVVGGAQVGAQLISQKYGRNAELESDYYGIQYMARAGYDPAAAIALQQTFVRLSEGRQSSWIDGLFASHPPSMQRVDANKKTVAELGNPKGELGKDRYQQHIAFLKQTKPAYDSFDTAQALLGEGDYDAARAKLVSAIDMVPNEARFHGLLGNIYYQQKAYDQATDAYSRALSLDDSYFEYHLGQGLVLSKQGKPAAAKQYLQRSNELLPTAVANNELGQLSLLEGDRQAAKSYFSTAASNNQSPIGQAASKAYIRLDLPDNPESYFAKQPHLSTDGILYASIQNRTEFDVAKVEVSFSAIVNNQQIQRTVATAIEAGTAVNVSSGWQFTADDTISDVVVSIVGASL